MSSKAVFSTVCALALVLLQACALPERHSANLDNQAEFVTIDVGFGRYLIDPRTEACFLIVPGYHEFMMAPVDCQKVAKNVPEARKHLTWTRPPRDP